MIVSVHVQKKKKKMKEKVKKGKMQAMQPCREVIYRGSLPFVRSVANGVLPEEDVLCAAEEEESCVCAYELMAARQEGLWQKRLWNKTHNNLIMICAGQ